jgi:hypothetical protein
MSLRAWLRSVLVPLGVLALAAVSVALPTGAEGSASGRWHQLSARRIVLGGAVLRSDGELSHQLRAELMGTLDGGEFRGRMVEVAPSMGPEPDGLWHLEYDVIGGYARGKDGVLRFQARLFLDLRPLGLPWSLPSGEMRGTLQTEDLPPSFLPFPGGYCPGPMSPLPTAPYLSWPDGNSALRSSGGALPAPQAARVGGFRAHYWMFD